MEPAYAKACPTRSIQFGEIEELKANARARVETLHQNGVPEAYLYGEDAASQPGTEGLHAFFLLLDKPEVYNLPPDPEVPTEQGKKSWISAGLAAIGVSALAIASVMLGSRE